METKLSIMNNSDDRTNLALGFLRTAYKDYIAARVLLNKGYTIQGVMLASTAIEKYFKAGICICTGKLIHKHLDRFDIIKKAVEDMGYGILIEKIDPAFIEILSKAYTLRYYDKIKEPITIGFFKNQFLGELDGAVELFERLFVLSKTDTKEPVLTPLKQDYKSKNPDLFENNWVTTEKKDKKIFMETDCEGFAIHILPFNVFEEIHVSSVKMTLPYTGTMTLINVNGEGN